MRKWHENGIFHLTTGVHELKVNTFRMIEKVYLSFAECDYQVCIANVNLAGVALVHHGFIVYADIKTEYATLEWKAESIA